MCIDFVLVRTFACNIARDYRKLFSNNMLRSRFKVSLATNADVYLLLDNWVKASKQGRGCIKIIDVFGSARNVCILHFIEFQRGSKNIDATYFRS